MHGPDSAPPSKRPLSVTLVALVFALFTFSAGAQAVMAAVGSSDDPALLMLQQSLSALAAGATAVLAWRRHTAAPYAAMIYGINTSVLVASLGPVLNLSETDRQGLIPGAIGVLVISLALAWLLWRGVRIPPTAR